jgi:hypothetical protein
MSIPSGFVKIKVKIDSKGNYHREIIREGKSSCKDHKCDTLLEDLLDVDLEGFDVGGNIEDEGKTKEYYEQNKIRAAKPLSEIETPIMTPGGSSEKRLDMGYGV